MRLQKFSGRPRRRNSLYKRLMQKIIALKKSF
jgi:hypothetical protein